MNANRYFTTTALLTLFLTSIASQCGAEAALAGDEVPRLFEQAVVAQGENYHILRSNIVTRGNSVVDFLRAQTLSTNLHARVVARGMLSWIDNPETNLLRGEQLAEIVIEASKSRGGAALGLGSFIEGAAPTWSVRPPPKGLEKREPPDPFLLEVALKGPPPLNLDQRKRAWRKVFGHDSKWVESKHFDENYGLYAQCYAAGKVGGCEGADVIPVLVELLHSPQDELRAFAAGGLRRTRSMEAIEPLLGALSDSAAKVRRVAYYGLMELTGQDFRKGLVMEKDPVVTADQIDDDVRKQFQEWWQQNKERLLSNPEVQK